MSASFLRPITGSPRPMAPGQPAVVHLLLGFLACLLLASCRTPPPEPIVVESTPPPDAPRLVLVIVVDQLRADYLDRFSPLLEGGLARLRSESVDFRETHHEHAHTVTATGHASLSTGLFPMHHGVIGNGWYDRSKNRTVQAVTDPDHGVSPRALEQGTLGDYLKTAYPDARSFGVGGKDRSAMMMAGLKANGAFFYDRRSGDFETSSFYSEVLPPWLVEFNEAQRLDRYFGTTWEPLLSLEEAAPYDIVAFDHGLVERGFPYPIGGLSGYPDSSFYSQIYGLPMIDEYVVELAKALIDGERLGQDAVPDFLAVTLSAVDSIGHSFGPNSLELLDTVLRVDRVLGDLLDHVDRVIGRDRVIVALSADHGVGIVPEILLERGVPARRLDAEIIGCFQGLGKKLDQRFGAERWLESGLYLDRDLVAEKGVPLADIQKALADWVAECPGIARTYTSSELLADTALDTYGELFRKSHHPSRSPDVEVLVEPDALLSYTTASHGSPYPYDTHVPWLLRLPRVAPRIIEERTATVDVAATIAPYLGLDIGERLDGEDRSALYTSPVEAGVESSGL